MNRSTASMEHTDTTCSGTEEETSSTTDISSFDFDPENPPNRMDVPLFILVHQENTPLRANPGGYKIFDFMTSVINRGLLESTTILVRIRESRNLFRVHKQLFEATFIHFPFIYDHIPDIDEEVYTFHIGSDHTVARFVQWLYYYQYPERIDLDALTRIKMPSSRFASLDEYLLQTPRPCVSSPTSTINMAVDRGLTLNDQGEPIVYTQAQKDFITDRFPFLVHLRMYIFATQYGLNLLQVEAFRMARACLDDSYKMRMSLERRDIICECLEELASFILVGDEMLGFIEYILRIHTWQRG